MLGDREQAGEQDPEQPGDQNVRVHDGVGGGTGVLGGEDPLPEAAAAADQFGDDVDDQRDRHGNPQPGGDEWRGAGQYHHQEPPYAAHLQRRRRVPDRRVDRPDSVEHLDD